MSTNWLEVQRQCGKCKGTGEVPVESFSYDNVPTPVTTIAQCPDCSGEGYVVWGRVKQENNME